MDNRAEEIGRYIREERKKKGLTQAIVAQKAGIAVNSLRLYEAGKRFPNVEQLQRIANAIDIDVFSLMDFDMATEAMLDRMNDRTRYLLAAFDQLNDEGQGKAVERVEELTEIPRYKK